MPQQSHTFQSGCKDFSEFRQQQLQKQQALNTRLQQLVLTLSSFHAKYAQLKSKCAASEETVLKLKSQVDQLRSLLADKDRQMEGAAHQVQIPRPQILLQQTKALAEARLREEFQRKMNQTSKQLVAEIYNKNETIEALQLRVAKLQSQLQSCRRNHSRMGEHWQAKRRLAQQREQQLLRCQRILIDIEISADRNKKTKSPC